MTATPKKLCIVDDELMITEILKTHFERRGFQVSICASGEEAVKFLTEQPVDIILLDYKLKEAMTGLDVLRKLRENNLNAKIIFSSGRLEDEVKKEAQSLGVNIFLTKPVLMSDLDKVIEECLKGG